MSGTESSQGREPSEKKFRQMTLVEKGAFVCKAVVFLVTFGFAFPNIFVD